MRVKARLPSQQIVRLFFPALGRLSTSKDMRRRLQIRAGARLELSAVVNGGTGGDLQLRADKSFQGLLGIP
jgi:hypothetical protein